MANIVLKDRSGNDITYPGVNKINVNTDKGETQSFAAFDPETLIPENIKEGVSIGGVDGSLTTPELIEETFELDFSDGDMGYAPGRLGKAYSEIIIKQPETLIPENIAEGVDIAGIIGALAGGKDVKIYNSWYIKPSTSSSHTIKHNLGVVPDIIIFHGTNYLTSSANKMLVIWGCSDAAYTKFGLSYKQYVLYQTPAPAVTNSYTQTASITATSVTAGKAWISNATETSIKIHYYNGNNGQLDTSNYHHVLIIGGLT